MIMDRSAPMTAGQRYLQEGTGIVSSFRSFSLCILAAVLFMLPEMVSAEITEPRVDSIQVTGTVPLSENKLLEGTGLEVGASLLRLTPVQLRDGAEANLRAMGYLDAQITVQWPLWDDEINIVRISVDARDRSLFSGLVFSGVTIFSPDSLATLYPSEPGYPITPIDTLKFRNAVQKLYDERGYIYSSVDISLSGMTGLHDGEGNRTVECSVTEGEQAVLDSVTVSGIESVRRKVNPYVSSIMGRNFRFSKLPCS